MESLQSILPNLEYNREYNYLNCTKLERIFNDNLTSKSVISFVKGKKINTKSLEYENTINSFEMYLSDQLDKVIVCQPEELLDN